MRTRRHRRRRCSRAIVVDLGWSRTNWSRTAIAWSDAKSGRVKVDLLGPDDWIEDWVKDLLLPGGVVGLDIPVEGCETLGKGASFRLVDRAMIKAGIPLLPAVRAGSFGREVATRVREMVPDCRVVEVYPYAVLRVLWSLYQAGEERPIKAMKGSEWVTLLHERAWSQRPPSYKRARDRKEMIKALKSITTLLNGSPYGRALDDLTDDPFALMKRVDLVRMTDALDALLGLVALDEQVRCSPNAKVFSVPGHSGAIVGLADTWLWGRWSKIVRALALEKPR
jgi:predicted nuclease with RNAse H fold